MRIFKVDDGAVMSDIDSALVGIEHEGIERDEETEGAVLFNCQDQQVWIPRSQLDEYDEDMMVIPRWLADKRDLEPDWEL